ncbi:MAG: triose-phosphate isomerase [Oligoflexales bacterium]|nr:triose-phosphate isomerase [Oligoflexales bacterium]
MRKKLMAGNWKMNKLISELSLFFNDFAKDLKLQKGSKIENVDIVFAVPFLQLAEAKKLAEPYGFEIAAQNVHFEPSGAFTGEISIGMLKEIGIMKTLVGHSERRQFFGETDESVAKKVSVCLKSGITPIACVGETKEERVSGKTENVLTAQMMAIMNMIDNPTGLVIAYEPVWAIGTGLTATDDQAAEAHRFIRKLIRDKYGSLADELRILYGGSAKPSNIAGLLSKQDIDGGLVGGASLAPSDFASMVRSAM